MKGFVLAFLITAVVLAGGYVTAQEFADASENTKSVHAVTEMRDANGVVVSFSPTTLVLRTESGSTQSFVVDDSTVLPSSTALAAGSTVTVEYQTLGSSAHHAAEIVSRGVATDPNATGKDRLPSTAGGGAVFGWSFLSLSGALVLRRVARSRAHQS